MSRENSLLLTSVFLSQKEPRWSHYQNVFSQFLSCQASDLTERVVERSLPQCEIYNKNGQFLALICLACGGLEFVYFAYVWNKRSLSKRVRERREADDGDQVSSQYNHDISLRLKHRVRFSTVTMVQTRSVRKERVHAPIEIMRLENAILLVQENRLLLFQMKLDDLEVRDVIGSGYFKVVYSGMWRSHAVAISCMKANGMHAEARLQEQIPYHPHLVTCYTVLPDAAGNEMGIMELLPLGSLEPILRRHRSIPIHHRLQMCTQICQAMEHLVNQGIIHRDLALRNILVQSLDPVIVKVADLGLAKSVECLRKGEDSKHAPQNQEVLPIRWLSPEVLQSLAWSEKSDVWAFGMTMWEIFANGREPYADICATEVAVVAHVLRGGTPQRPVDCPDDISAIMKRCWRFCPEDRPSFNELICLLRTVNVQAMNKRTSLLPQDVRNSTEVSEMSSSYATVQEIFDD